MAVRSEKLNLRRYEVAEILPLVVRAAVNRAVLEDERLFLVEEHLYQDFASLVAVEYQLYI